jgi:hypothetical protein
MPSSLDYSPVETPHPPLNSYQAAKRKLELLIRYLAIQAKK